MKYKTNYCFQCGIRKKYDELITDFVDINRKLCKDCYDIRDCFCCGRDYPVQYLLKDSFLPNLLCINCYYYEIMMCDRCERMFYEYNLYDQKDGQLFCEKCDYYEAVANKQN